VGSSKLKKEVLQLAVLNAVDIEKAFSNGLGETWQA